MWVGYLEIRGLYVKWHLFQNRIIYIQKLYLGFLVVYSIGSHYEGSYEAYSILKKQI